MGTSIPEVKLASSTTATIPLLGFGTAEYPFGGTKTMKESIFHAIKLGYRHFDTAAVYKSEQFLGEAIAEALQVGLIKSRSELFITSKLWCGDGHADRVLPALNNTLKNLGLEYLDLYLIHFPVSLKAGTFKVPFDKEDVVPLDIKSVWEVMEKCHQLGLCKAIGVSNFSSKRLQQLLSTAKIPPAVNQVEMNPLWQQKQLTEYCKGNGIHVTAYSPLGARGTMWGTNHVMESAALKEIALARGKTVAQVCLRWVYEQGVSVLVKSFNKERMEENLRIFDWTLSTEDNEKIGRIPQKKGSLAYEFISDEGPYKSLEELWDEPM